MSAIETKTERAINAFISSIAALAGASFHSGHEDEDLDSLPRIITTCSRGEEPALGLFKCDLSIQGIDEVGNRDRLREMQRAISDALCEDEIPTVKAFVNAPESGPDNRAVKGFALSGLMFNDSAEGRDTDKNLQGFILTYSAWVSLTE